MPFLWKSLGAGMKSQHEDFIWETGKWYEIKSRLEICRTGFHASQNIVDAMWYVRCSILAKVEVQGGCVVHYDKQCWEKMRIVQAHNWTIQDSVFMAVYSADLVLGIFETRYPDDKRPREAIEIAKQYILCNGKYALKNKHASITNAAYAAANTAYAATCSVNAATNAAYAAASAANAASAARAANTANAAYAAAHAAYAASAVDCPDNSIIKNKIHAWIVRRLKSK